MTEVKLLWIEEEVRALQENGLFINLRTIESAPGAWMVVDGQRVLNLCTNNYLGLADDSG
jgi:glycine C-acetyltransferase